MDNHIDLYQKNLLALGFVIRQGAARVRRRWYHESSANFDTIDNYEYDETGRLHTITETFSRGSSSVSTYYYDEQDRLILMYKHDSYGQSLHELEYIVETPEGAVILIKISRTASSLREFTITIFYPHPGGLLCYVLTLRVRNADVPLCGKGPERGNEQSKSSAGMGERIWTMRYILRISDLHFTNALPSWNRTLPIWHGYCRD